MIITACQLSASVTHQNHMGSYWLNTFLVSFNTHNNAVMLMLAITTCFQCHSTSNDGDIKTAGYIYHKSKSEKHLTNSQPLFSDNTSNDASTGNNSVVPAMTVTLCQHIKIRYAIVIWHHFSQCHHLKPWHWSCGTSYDGNIMPNIYIGNRHKLEEW